MSASRGLLIGQRKKHNGRRIANAATSWLLSTQKGYLFNVMEGECAREMQMHILPAAFSSFVSTTSR